MLAARNHRVLLYVKSVADSSVRHCTKHPTLPVVHELHDIVKWRKPEKLPTWDPRKTGDLQELPPVDPKWIRLEYQAFESLISKLPEDQRKFFTVGFGRRKDGYNIIKKNMISSVQRHIYDGREKPERSHETRIAWFTFQIRNIRERADAVKAGEKMESIGSLTKRAQEFTFKRRKYLNQLRHLDYKRFEWLLENLGVLFKPLPEFKKIRRRPAVDRLTGIICDEIISKKMQAYKDELEAQKIPFLENKLSILEEIKADEEKMKLASSVDEEIQKTLKLLEHLTGSHMEIHPVQSLEKTPSAIP